MKKEIIRNLKSKFKCGTIEELATVLGVTRSVIFNYQNGTCGGLTKRYIEIINILINSSKKQLKKSLFKILEIDANQ